MDLKAKVLVPLYIYPLTEKTWQPLYDAIIAYPKVEFLVIVNPNSGPGGLPLPGHDYVREVPKLNMHANVSTVGYIRIDYCKKPLSEVYAEIEAYAGWSQYHEHAGLGVEGILLDETPNHYSEDRVEYLHAVGQHVKSTCGILGERLVMHNPGTPPDTRLADPAPAGPDVIITCEEPYHLYKGEGVQKRLAEYHYEQVRSGYMISAVPGTQIGPLVGELRERGAYLFVTELVDDFYESFGTSWGDFMASMDSEQ